MAAGHVPEEIRNKGVWHEAIKTATNLDALAAITINNQTKTRIEHWSGKLPAYASHLKTWGEAGTVKIKDKMTTKIEDRGITCMFVGYAKQHSGDCYHMLNLTTMGIHETRDIIWLHHFDFPSKMQHLDHAIVPTVTFDLQAGERGTETLVNQNNQNNNQEDHDKIFERENGDDDDNSNEEQNLKTTRSGWVIKPVARLEINPNNKSYGSDNDKQGDNDGSEVRDLTNAEVAFYAAIGAFDNKYTDKEFACVGLGTGDGFLDTSELHVMKYKDAMETKDANNWQDAINKEHE